MANDTEVRNERRPQEDGFQTLLEGEPRAKLPASLPAPRVEAKTADQDALGDALSIREVARLLGCSVWTVRQRCLPQGLPYFRVAHSGKLMFYRNQVIRWILEKQRGERR
jgi:hypothetical protein